MSIAVTVPDPRTAAPAPCAPSVCIRPPRAVAALHLPEEGYVKRQQTLSQKMRVKIDTPEARQVYSQRLAIVEPVFANLRHNKRLSRFTYRTRKKVTTQWRLYCLVHNLEKSVRCGRSLYL
jgi:Transposase DDE domain